jgi:hypothetical protein
LYATGKSAGTSRRRKSMSEERTDQDESKETKTEDDVEAHRRARMANDEQPAAEEESDDVEAHARRASHREM